MLNKYAKFGKDNQCTVCNSNPCLSTCSKQEYGKDNSGMVLDEKEWRNLMIDIMCDAMGCTNWDFGPNENGDKFIKKWTEVFKQRFSQQPPKERKVSLEEIEKVMHERFFKDGVKEMNPYDAKRIKSYAKAILSLINATEGQ